MNAVPHCLASRGGARGVCLAFLKANRVLRGAGVDLDGARRMTSLFYDSIVVPISAENIRFIATSKWRVQL